MFLGQTFRMCFKNILSNKLRSFLTMLGIIIGISSVIILVGFTTGTSQDINSSLEDLGANVLTVNIYNDDETLTYDDIKEQQFSFVEKVLPTSQGRTYARVKSTGSSFTFIGTTPDFLSVQKLYLTDGRNLSDLDIENSSNVALVGSEVVSTLFENNRNPIGEKILLGSSYYTIVGILEDGSTSSSDMSSSIIAPITTYAKTSNDDSISKMYFVANEDLNDTRMIENMINSQLGRLISTENIEIVTQDTVSETVSEIDSMTTLLIGLVGAISLIVSGIGVMNIMIVSVSERTREIGVRKAIGATDFDILKQFLIEAILLTSFGGVIGVIVGYLFNFISSWIGITFVMSLPTVLISLGFSVVIGLIFGIIPAIRASKLKPIDALKHD